MDKEVMDKLMEIKKLYESGILTEEEYQMQEENLINSCNNTTANLDGFCNNLKSASNLNGNLNCSKELEHYSS